MRTKTIGKLIEEYPIVLSYELTDESSHLHVNIPDLLKRYNYMTCKNQDIPAENKIEKLKNIRIQKIKKELHSQVEIGQS